MQLSRQLLSALLLAAPVVSQANSQSVYGGAPAAQSPTLASIGTHNVSGSGGTFSAPAILVDVPRFDPAMGILTGVEVRCRGLLDYGTIQFSTVFGLFARFYALRSVTNVTFTGPGLNATGNSIYNLSGTLGAFSTGTTREVPTLGYAAPPATIPVGSLNAWIGSGTLLISVQAASTYTITFGNSNNSVWPLSGNAQIEVIYSYEERGRSTRGLPGKGPSTVSFSTNGTAGYSMNGHATLDPAFRDGTQLSMADDSVVDQPLPFSFRMPNGTLVNSIRIDSNGRVSDPAFVLGSDYSPSESEFLSATSPILAPCWHDFSPDEGGSVWFHADANRATVTWFEVPEFGVGNANTFQLQLFPDGTFKFLFVEMNLTSPAVMVGASQGSGAGLGNTVDLSATVVGTPSTVPATAYEWFSGVWDLDTDTTQPVLAARTEPNLGANYELEVQAPSTALGATLIAGVPAAMNLGSVFPGSDLTGHYLRVELGSMIASPMSLTQPLALPIPNDVSLRGSRIELQAVTLDPVGANNALSLGFSNALTAQIGG